MAMANLCHRPVSLIDSRVLRWAKRHRFAATPAVTTFTVLLRERIVVSQQL